MFPPLRPKSGSAGASPSRLAREIYHEKRETHEPETALGLVNPLQPGTQPTAMLGSVKYLSRFQPLGSVWSWV